MSNNEWSFWKDEAKPPIFDFNKIVVKSMSLIGYCVLFLAAPAIGVNIGLSGVYSRFLTIIAGLIVLPSVIAFQLFYSGKTAGKRMKDQIDELTDAKSQKAAFQSLKIKLPNYRDELIDHKNWAKANRPTTGRASEMPEKTEQFYSDLRKRIVECLRRFNQELEDLIPDGIETSDIDSLESNFDDWIKCLDRKLSRVDSIENVIDKNL